MNSEEILTTALAYEKKIRDLYLDAVDTIDDERGKSFFKALADDEQSHVDFLTDNFERLKKSEGIDWDRLRSPLPDRQALEKKIEKMKDKIPERMLGDFKTVLSSALQLEIETSAYYRDACEKTQGEIKSVLEKFLEIEQNHVDLVQFELDLAAGSGHWLNFMEIDMEY